jgi:subtilisin family serine protease
VAGTAVGNTQGWARDANIYNISIYGTNQNFGTLGLDASTYWDYVRAWHNSKPINAVTGRRNPTITNHSYGSSITYTTGDFGPVTQVTYRGTNFAPGRALTVGEMQARGFFTNDTTPGPSPFYSTAREADIQDAIDDGIVVISAAGNESWKIVNSSDQDYNNSFLATFQGTNFSWWLHRGNGGGGAGYAPVITVGAVGINKEEYKGTFSNCGNQVDIFAAGTAIQSSLHTASGSLSSSSFDPRNSSFYFGKYQGTSMATPQVTGIITCLAEHWPNIRQTEAIQWLIDFCNKNQMGNTGEDNPMQVLSLQGAPNRFAKWTNQRPVDGGTFPQRNFRPRTVDGDPVYYGKRLWPRPRIRRRG